MRGKNIYFLLQGGGQTHCLHCCCHCTNTTSTTNNNAKHKTDTNVNTSTGHEGVQNGHANGHAGHTNGHTSHNHNSGVTFSTNVTRVNHPTAQNNNNSSSSNGLSNSNLKSVLKQSEGLNTTNSTGGGGGGGTVVKNKTEILISGDQTSVISCSTASALRQDTTATSDKLTHRPSDWKAGSDGNHVTSAFSNVNISQYGAAAPEPRSNVVRRPRPKSVAVPNPSASSSGMTIFYHHLRVD